MDPVSLAGAAGSQRRLKNQQETQKRWKKASEDQKNRLLAIGMAKSGFGADLKSQTLRRSSKPVFDSTVGAQINFFTPSEALLHDSIRPCILQRLECEMRRNLQAGFDLPGPTC
jgi:hypothetical protein